MKTNSINILILLGVIFYGCTTEYQAQNGDIIFQTSRSSQSAAIQRATKSKYSHMGIVYIKNGQLFVFEAIEPVQLTPFREWIARGEGEHFVVKRLLKADKELTQKAFEQMLKVGQAFKGKHYDLYFEWSDDRIYCSELVWKIYKRALDLEVGKLQVMQEFDFSDPVVQKKMRERFGDALPKNEKVISPAAIFDSELLITVYEN